MGAGVRAQRRLLRDFPGTRAGWGCPQRCGVEHRSRVALQFSPDSDFDECCLVKCSFFTPPGTWVRVSLRLRERPRPLF